MSILTKGWSTSTQDNQDYVSRYEQRPQSVSEQEALTRYQQVSSQLPPEAYKQAAEDAFARMSPQQRLQLGQALIQGAQQQGVSFPDVNRDGIDDRLQDPGYLAQMTTQVHQEQPGLLGQLLGSGGGGGGGNPLGGGLGKVALGGIAAMGLSRLLGGRGRGGGIFGGGGYNRGGHH